MSYKTVICHVSHVEDVEEVFNFVNNIHNKASLFVSLASA